MAIEPLAVASDGYLCGSGFTLSVSTNGYLCTVTVSPTTTIPPTTQPPTTAPPDAGEGLGIAGGGFGYAGLTYFLTPKKSMWEKPTTGDTKEEKVKLITVKIRKDGKEYVKKQYTRDLTLEAKDVKFDIIEDGDDVKIKIFFDD